MSPLFRSLLLTIALCFSGSAIAQPAVSKPPDAKELDALWSDLADTDAARAYRALCRLAAHPASSAPFLRTLLRPVPPLDEKEIARLIAGLDSDSFEEREKAQKDLEHFGEPIRPHARKGLTDSAGPESKRRLEAVLQWLDEEVLPPESLRSVRAVEALERMGTLEARRLLRELAAGAPGSRLTREAEASLSRITVRP